MKKNRIGYILLAATVIIIILVAGGYQLPKYASRLTYLAVLAVVDILYWISIRPVLAKRFMGFFTMAYWLPMLMLMVFFIAGLFAPYTDWSPFFRIYFPGILLILLIGKGFFLIVLLLGDILIIPIWVIRKFLVSGKVKLKWKRPKLVLFLAAGIASFFMLLYVSGMIFWVNDPKLNTVEIQVADLPDALDGYKIIQLSDIHLGSFINNKSLLKIIDITNNQKPDLILYTGDLLNFTTDEAFPFEEDMKKFKTSDGIFTILGNHDYGEYRQWDTPEAKAMNDIALFDFYSRIGWKLLRNQNQIIKRDSVSLAIIGVENWSVTKRFGKKGDLKKAISGAELSQYKILMSHDPSHWDGEINTSYPQIDLTLSGHTHAFQLAIETGSIKWSPASLLFRQWAGLYEKVHENGVKQFLYVNRGAGYLGYPGRIATRPEITLLILRKAR